jgi:hypothetical protein
MRGSGSRRMKMREAQSDQVSAAARRTGKSARKIGKILILNEFY